ALGLGFATRASFATPRLWSRPRRRRAPLREGEWRADSWRLASPPAFPRSLFLRLRAACERSTRLRPEKCRRSKAECVHAPRQILRRSRRRARLGFADGEANNLPWSCQCSPIYAPVTS